MAQSSSPFEAYRGLDPTTASHQGMGNLHRTECKTIIKKNDDVMYCCKKRKAKKNTAIIPVVIVASVIKGFIVMH